MLVRITAGIVAMHRGRLETGPRFPRARACPRSRGTRSTASGEAPALDGDGLAPLWWPHS
jgi:hypothetical protein